MREEAEQELWGDLAGSSSGGADDGVATENVSANLLVDLGDESQQFVETRDAMENEEAAQAAECFDRLASHGMGHVVLDLQEFQELLLKLAADPKGQKLLNILLKRKAAKK